MDRVVRGQTNKLDDKYESFPFLVANSNYSFSGNSSLSPRFSVTPQHDMECKELHQKSAEV